jgi:hypothetical protein
VAGGCGEAAEPLTDGGADRSGGDDAGDSGEGPLCQTGLQSPAGSAQPALKLRLTAGDAAAVGPAARLRLRLYATDSSYADQSATLVGCVDAPVSGLPAEVDVAIPSDAATLVSADLGGRTAPEDLYFYVTFYVDNDADGQICTGTDLSQDYETAGPLGFRGTTPPEQRADLGLKPYPDLPCSDP